MCWKCKTNITLEKIYRTSECPECHRDLHCCRNCIFYEAGSRFDCHETIEECISDKEKANFCDSFKVRREFSGGGNAGYAEKKAAAKKALDNLFSI